MECGYRVGITSVSRQCHFRQTAPQDAMRGGARPERERRGMVSDLPAGGGEVPCFGSGACYLYFLISPERRREA